MLYYKDYFGISEDYAPCMTREDINRSPETWLNFYPHETFVSLLRDLLASLDGGDKSIWLTGAYGTGKSHAAPEMYDEIETTIELLQLVIDTYSLPEAVKKGLKERIETGKNTLKKARGEK
ncbi:MAG TPA: hypothetical protein P5040_04115 [Smithella sp.]|nr:hypothetical protein [Smithella sp.]